jgi:ribosome-binding protein aMBF1 (putative translation factor)
MVAMRATRSLTDQIRDAVEGSGLSRYRIAKELRIAESTMSRFMRGKGGLRLKTVDELAKMLGLSIITSTRRPRRD